MIDRRRLPLSQLRAFEAAGRLGSFKDAAAELSLTQSAVSHHVRSLQELIGVRLFHRVGKTTTLTPEGIMLLEASSGAFDCLSDAVMAAQRRTSDKTAKYQVNLAVAPSFATRWLLPRIQKFQRRFPDVQVNITAAMSVSQGNGSDFDAAIIYDRQLATLEEASTLVFRELAIPVCAPSLVPKRKGKVSPDEIDHFNIILNATDPWDWVHWCNEVGVDPIKLHSKIVFDNDDLAIQSALAAHGIALPELRFIEGEIYNRRLVAPFDVRPVQLGGYHFIKYADRPFLDDLHIWLRDEARNFKFETIKQYL